MMSPVTIATPLTNGREHLNGHLEATVNGKLEPAMNGKLDQTMLNGKLEPVNGFRKNGFVKQDPTDYPVSDIVI